MFKNKHHSFLYQLSLIYLWLVLTVTGVVVSILGLGLNQKRGVNFFPFRGQKTFSHYILYSQLVSVPTGQTIYQTKVFTQDARVLIVDRYLRRYNSPMIKENPNIASLFVEMADEYDLPWTLLPAIAQCESNLGKHTPPHCYNAWGYGIHSKGTLCFSSWEEGIRRVAKGLSQDYLSQGLVKPESIMEKYTPVSNGSWARCVDHFTQELKEGIE